MSVKGNEDVSFFTPKQPILGEFIGYTREENREPPVLFRPLKINSLNIPNRICVSPMCTYSSLDSKPTIFHMVHYGSFSVRGPGLIIVECCAINERSRVTPNDIGLWNEEQAIQHFEKIVEFAHSQNVVIGCQLGFFNGNKLHPIHKLEDMSINEIHGIIKQWGKSAKLAINVAKYDFIEIQASHGHIIDFFCSPLLNKRTDLYGGSFENRIRFLLELIKEVRANISEDVPIFIRLPDCEKDESIDSWKQKDTIELSLRLSQVGVDVIDFVFVNKGNLKLIEHNDRTEFLNRIKRAHLQVSSKILFASPGNVTSATEAERLIRNNQLDFVMIGQLFLKNPALVSTFAEELEIKVTEAVQYSWGFYPTPEYKK